MIDVEDSTMTKENRPRLTQTVHGAG